MKSIITHRDIFRKIPNLLLLTGRVVVGEVDRDLTKKTLNESWQSLQAQLRNEGAKNHPLISKWRETLRAVGTPVKDCPISIEAIAKRAAKGGEVFSINPIVDTYNSISMELVLPFGAYDTADLQGNMQLRLSQGGEKFIALGSNEIDSTVPNEIVFADDNDILTRHFLWRQSDKAKITENTKEFIFVCELLSDMGEDVIEKAKALISSRFRSLLGVESLEIEEARG